MNDKNIPYSRRKFHGHTAVMKTLIVPAHFSLLVLSRNFWL